MSATSFLRDFFSFSSIFRATKQTQNPTIVTETCKIEKTTPALKLTASDLISQNIPIKAKNKNKLMN